LGMHAAIRDRLSIVLIRPIAPNHLADTSQQPEQIGARLNRTFGTPDTVAGAGRCDTSSTLVCIQTIRHPSFRKTGEEHTGGNLEGYTRRTYIEPELPAFAPPSSSPPSCAGSSAHLPFARHNGKWLFQSLCSGMARGVALDTDLLYWVAN